MRCDSGRSHEDNPEARTQLLTFVVVGGPTGVELAGQLVELRGNFRRIDPAEARVVLLDAAPAILPSFPPSLQRRTGVEHDVSVFVAGSTTTSISPPSLPSEHVTRVPSSTRMR